MTARPEPGARQRFAVTFERYTPESVEHGDAAARGFIVAAGTLRDCVPEVAHGFARPDYAGHAEPDSTRGRVRFLSFHDYREDVATGETEARALHVPDGLTAASAARVARLFGVRVNA